MLIWRAFRLIFRNALCIKYGKAVRLRQNLFLKWLLIVQSFSPLFVLLLVKYIKKDVSKLVFKFINLIVDGNISAAIPSAFFHEEILRVTICLFCTILILFGGWIYYYFKGRELAGFIDRAEKISINGDTTEMSIAFFTTYIFGLLMVQEALLKFLTGELIPLSFFPGAVQKVFDFLPFSSMVYTPVMIYLGKYNNKELAFVLGRQAAWVIILYLLGSLIWKKVTRRLVVLGG